VPDLPLQLELLANNSLLSWDEIPV